MVQQLRTARDRPPAVPLQRVHSSLRALRSSLASLVATLDLDRAREETRALLRPPVPVARSDWHGEGKGKSNAERDTTWGPDEDSQGPPRAGANTKTYASRRRKAAAASTATRIADATTTTTRVSDKPGTRPLQQRVALSPADVTRHLSEHGAQGSALLKARHVYATWSNILEICHPRPTGHKTARQRGSSIVGPLLELTVAPTVTVPSLVEIASKKLAWDIEPAVKACLIYAEELKEMERDGDLPQGGTGTTDQEDENLLVDEWYTCCNEYTWSWILVQHATCIVLDGLKNKLPCLSHLLFMACLDHGALSEATRFLPLLQASIFAPLPPLSTSLHHSYALALQTLPYQLSSAYLTALEAALLESGFSDRLFFSPLLSLARIKLITSAAERDLVCGIILVLARVARMMLGGIRASLEGDDNEEELREVQALSAEIVNRLASEVGHVLHDVIKRDAGRNCGLGRETRLELVDELLLMVEEFGEVAHSLGSIITALLLGELLEAQSAVLRDPIAADDLFASLAHLVQLSAGDSSTIPISQTDVAMAHISLGLPLVATWADSALITLVQDLHAHQLSHLAASLIQLIIQQRAPLERQCSVTAEALAEWETVLSAAEGKCIALEAAARRESQSGGEKPGWRFEDMVGGYVTITPGRPRALVIRRPLQFTALTPLRPRAVVSTPLHRSIAQGANLSPALSMALPPSTLKRLSLAQALAKRLQYERPTGQTTLSTLLEPARPRGVASLQAEAASTPVVRRRSATWAKSAPVPTDEEDTSFASSSFNSMRLSDLSNLASSSPPSSINLNHSSSPARILVHPKLSRLQLIKREYAASLPLPLAPAPLVLPPPPPLKVTGKQKNAPGQLSKRRPLCPVDPGKLGPIKKRKQVIRPPESSDDELMLC